MKLAIAKPKARLFFLDNIRIFLTITVIFHHAAIAYGGAGDWAIQEAATDAISPILLTLFNALNQSYFMSAFFLFAGYFTPRSLERKGTKLFLVDRLVRLGIPVLVYSTLVININDYILSKYTYRMPFQMRIGYEPGHLWFLQALLLFALIYVIFKAASGRRTMAHLAKLQERIPTDKTLFATILVLALLSFTVRILVPVGVWIFHFQLGHFVHYVFSFAVGILAYRGDWFRNLPSAQARRWGWRALAVIPLFFVIFILGGALESEANVAKFLGGFHWQAMAYALWESFLLIAINIFLLYFFRERFNRAGPAAKTMAATLFTVYIIHQTLLYTVQTTLLQIDMPSIMKFLLSASMATFLAFVLSIMIRQIPYTKRVLG